jgi:hypothetical protein
MVGLADRIAAEFPPGVAMPDELRQLCAFVERTDAPFSGLMNLGPEGEGLRAWFGEGCEAWRHLAGFGNGPDGSIFALWLYGGLDTTRSPIVHLGSEGDRLVVIADNLRAFLALLAIGYDELGFDDLAKPPEKPQTAEPLRQWVLSTFGIEAPRTGIELMRQAQMRHPSFERWIESVQGLHEAGGGE